MSRSGKFRSFVEEVRDRSDLVDVVARDVSLRRSGNTLKGLSPFHDEKHPSFVVWPATQSWHDFSNGGGLGGDVFAYVQQREKVGFKEALYLLAERAGVRRPDQDDEAWKQALAAATERREIEGLLTLAASYYHRCQPSEVREKYFKQHYGFTDEIIDELRLGWADGQLFAHLMKAGVSRRLALKTGLFVVFATGHVKDFFVNRLVFPYWRGGKVVYFTSRATEHTSTEPWEQSKYKKLLTRSERHRYVSATIQNDYFYNEDAARGAVNVVITEGVPDCISAMQSGVTCISPATTSFRHQDLPRLVQLTQSANRIVICNDSEVSGAGEAGAIEMAAALWAHGREACIATIPRPAGTDKIDLNELVVAQGPDALRAVLAEAKPYPEFLLDRIPADSPAHDLDRLLDPILTALVGRSPIRADPVLNAIVKKLGVRRRPLNARVKALAAVEKARLKVSAAKASADGVGTQDTAQTVTAAGPAEAPPGGPRLPAPRRPEICVTNRQLSDIVVDAHAALMAANERRLQRAAASVVENDDAPLFRRGNALVRLDHPEDGQPRLADVTEPIAYGLLIREIDWVRATEQAMLPVPPSDKIARDLIAFPGASFPRVSLVIATPTFGRGGQLLRTPGLHVDDRLWLEPDPSLQLGEIPEHPTADDIAAARALFFDDLLVDFPFIGPSDRAHALAALLLPFLRRLIDGCTPLHVIEAPAKGAGKGLLCNLVSILVSGEGCAPTTLPDSDDEIRKMLTAQLAMARPIVLLDNAKERHTLAAPALAAILTTKTWTDRLLGRTQMITVPNQAVWLLTAVNPRLAEDIARRSVLIRVDPKVDRAWLRTNFKHPRLTAWAKAHRRELVRAALVLVQAWISAGRPLSGAQLGSFEEWAGVMGGLLGIAGVDGFLANSTELYENADAEGQAWRELVAAWWDAHGEAAIHVSVLAALCEKHDLMSQIRGDGNARSQQTRLGRALHSVRGRTYGELQLVVGKADRTKRMLYALRPVGDTTTGHTGVSAGGDEAQASARLHLAISEPGSDQGGHDDGYPLDPDDDAGEVDPFG